MTADDLLSLSVVSLDGKASWSRTDREPVKDATQSAHDAEGWSLQTFGALRGALTWGSDPSAQRRARVTSVKLVYDGSSGFDYAASLLGRWPERLWLLLRLFAADGHVAADDGLVVVDLAEHGADEADDGVAVRECADDVGASADLAVEPLLRFAASPPTPRAFARGMPRPRAASGRATGRAPGAGSWSDVRRSAGSRSSGPRLGAPSSQPSPKPRPAGRFIAPKPHDRPAARTAGRPAPRPRRRGEIRGALK